LAKNRAIFSKYSAKNEIQCKKKYSAKLGFLIGLKHEAITKIANKIQQFPAEIIQKKQSRNITISHSKQILLISSNKIASKLVVYETIFQIYVFEN
jgi:hypothetical protein